MAKKLPTVHKAVVVAAEYARLRVRHVVGDKYHVIDSAETETTDLIPAADILGWASVSAYNGGEPILL